jgi:hypothetical protein
LDLTERTWQEDGGRFSTRSFTISFFSSTNINSEIKRGRMRWEERSARMTIINVYRTLI